MMRFAVAAALSFACAGARQQPVAPAAPATAASPGAERLGFVDGPAGRLHVSDGGSGGIPVVFVHGLTGDLETWRPQLNHLRQTRRAFALELRGHGQSDPPKDGNWSMEGLAEDIYAATRELPRFVLVGHSLAGAPLQVFAARHAERLAGLVFVDAIGSFQRFGSAGIKELVARELTIGADVAEQRKIIESLLDANARPATREQVLASMTHLPPKGFLALRVNLFQFVVPEDLRGSGIPLFSIEVERPRPVPIFFSALAPEAPRTTLSKVSHWLMLDDPEGFNTALDGFLATLK
jgi:pimeloyl-ACP methyl ester carboxylesterase